MLHRLPWISLVIAVAVCLVFMPACGKKPVVVDDVIPGIPAPPPVTSEHILFARLDGKVLRDGELFAEVKRALVKAGGATVEEMLNKETLAGFGVNTLDIDSATLCITEWSGHSRPWRFVALTTNRPINRSTVLAALKITPKPEEDNLFHLGDATYIWFSDEQTLVWLDGNQVERYFAGLEKDKNGTGWPLTPELTAAAAGHTLYVHVRPDKLPANQREHEFKELGPLLGATSATLTVDVKGKTVSLATRATFADAGTAAKAKEKSQELVGIAHDAVERLATGKAGIELGTAVPGVKEAQRALKEVGVQASGTDLTVSATYTADYDFGTAFLEAVKLVRESAVRASSRNNLFLVGLMLQIYNDAMGRMLVHGVETKKPMGKPLLSWRVAILPYLEYGGLHAQFKLDEPWDSEHNKQLIGMMPKVFSPVGKEGKSGYTHLQMVIGPKALQPVAGDIAASIPDGPARTIAVVEAAEPVIWTKPDDVMFPEKELPKDWRKKFGGAFPGGFHALMWDGSVLFVPDSVNDRTLTAMLTPAGGEVIENPLVPVLRNRTNEVRKELIPVKD